MNREERRAQKRTHGWSGVEREMRINEERIQGRLRASHRVMREGGEKPSSGTMQGWLKMALSEVFSERTRLLARRNFTEAIKRWGTIDQKTALGLSFEEMVATTWPSEALDKLFAVEGSKR